VSIVPANTCTRHLTLRKARARKRPSYHALPVHIYLPIDFALSVRPEWQVLCQAIARSVSKMVRQRCAILHCQYDEQLGVCVQHIRPSPHYPAQFWKRHHDGSWLAPREKVHPSPDLLCRGTHVGCDGVCLGRRKLEGMFGINCSRIMY
jgi:hypothetical protein